MINLVSLQVKRFDMNIWMWITDKKKFNLKIVLTNQN